MLFNNKKAFTGFYPTFLKEDRSFLRKINEMISNAESHIYIVCPWITLGEELVIPLENALANNSNLELYLITKLLKEDVFNRIQQLDDIEKWLEVLDGRMKLKYNNQIHSKMIIVDDSEVIVGSSNLTGSGLGSSRNYEGVPQIESNIYTTDEKTVEEVSGFFGKIWHHESSKEYNNAKYVLSCKSYNLSGIYQNYEKDFKKICFEEKIKYNNHDIEFKGTLCHLDKNNAYLIGKNRKDIAVKILNPDNKFKNNKIGDNIFVKGKIQKKHGISEFEINLYKSYKNKFKEKSPDKISKISNLKVGSKFININATVVNIDGPKMLDTKFGERYLTLMELQDDSGEIVFELWEYNPEKLLKEGEDIEIINAYIKEYEGNLRMTLHKNGEINRRR